MWFYWNWCIAVLVALPELLVVSCCHHNIFSSKNMHFFTRFFKGPLETCVFSSRRKLRHPGGFTRCCWDLPAGDIRQLGFVGHRPWCRVWSLGLSLLFDEKNSGNKAQKQRSWCLLKWETKCVVDDNMYDKYDIRMYCIHMIMFFYRYIVVI